MITDNDKRDEALLIKSDTWPSQINKSNGGKTDNFFSRQKLSIDLEYQVPFVCDIVERYIVIFLC